MADEITGKENEGERKIIHTYPLVKVFIQSRFSFACRLFDQ